MTEMTDLSTGCSVQDRSLSGRLRGSLEEMVSLKAFTKSSCSFRNICYFCARRGLRDK